jgi:protein SCO1/2
MIRLLLLLVACVGCIAAVDPPSIGVDERLGERLPADLVFHDQDGKAVRLAELADGRPLLLVPGYYRCPMLCGLVLNQVVDGLRGCDQRAGSDFAIVAVSFDAEDDRIAAARKRDAVAQTFADDPRLAGIAERWPFLVADQPTIDRLVAALGLRIAREGREIAHPAVVAVLTADGRISRYLHGIGWTGRDLSLAVVEAGEGRVGSATQQALLRCWSWDPATRRYRFAVASVLRVGGLAILVGIAIGFGALRRRARAGRA